MNPRAKSGVVAAVAVLLALAGTVLWLSLLAGPWRLASGLLDAREHLTKAEKALSSGAIKESRYRTLAAAAAVRRARAGLDSGGPLLDVARKLPVAGPALEEVRHLIDAAGHSAAVARGTLDIAQNALKGPRRIIVADPADPKGGAQIRIERVVELAEKVSDLRQELDGVTKALTAVELKNLPARARPGIERAIARAGKTDELLADAEGGLQILPGFLGAGEPRTYLLAMQNSAEQRGTGGAILQFKLLRIDDGKPELLQRGGSIYDIDENRDPISIPLPEDAWYVQAIEDAQRFGNANWSPDWPLSAKLTIDYGRASEADFPEIDGVIAVDPVTMRDLMPGTGPFRTKSGNRISSGKVVHFLLYKAYASFPAAPQRRAVLKQVVEGFYKKLLKPDHPTRLVEGMGSALSTKHMQIWLRDPTEQKFIERMDWDGAIEAEPAGDYVYVVEQNVGGNKLDYFDGNHTTVGVSFSGSDAMVSTEIAVANNIFLPQPRWPLGDTGPFHRPMVNLYVPLNAELAATEVTGGRIDSPPPAAWPNGAPPVHLERGRKVWSATLGTPPLGIPPGETASIRFDYRIPGVVTTDGLRNVYRLKVQHQPKVSPETLTVRIELPSGARAVKAPGLKREGDVLVWDKKLNNDIVLEASWRR